MNKSRAGRWGSYGLSRRQRSALRKSPNKCQLGFESLEDRRMMVYSAAAVLPNELGAGEGYYGVVMVNNGCTGTLLPTGRHILTAAHCVDMNYDGSTDPGTHLVEFQVPSGDPVFPLRSVTISVPAANIHIFKQGSQKWAPANSGADGGDLAIMELPVMAPYAAERWELYRDGGELGTVGDYISFVGYGRTNFQNFFANQYFYPEDPQPEGYIWNGGKGANPATFGVKRIGYNDIDAPIKVRPNSEWLIFDTDNPNGPTPGVPFEAGAAPGDSGGPLFINGQIAGVHSKGNPGFNGDGDRGESIYTRISTQPVLAWIEDRTNDPFDMVIDMAKQGTGDGADSITLASVRNPSGPNYLVVTVNGSVKTENLNRIRSIEIRGTNDSDAVRIQTANVGIDVPITVFGGGGALDSLVFDDSTLGSSGPWVMRLVDDMIERSWNAFPFTFTQRTSFSGFESLTYLGSSTTTSYVVEATPTLAFGAQTTIYGAASTDTFTVRTRNAAGQSMLQSPLTVYGLGGGDVIVIDDSASSQGGVWSVYNPFGVNMQSFSVGGGAFVNASSDVEGVRLKGTQQTDNFNFSSYMNGTSVTVEGGGGADVLNIGFSSPGLNLTTGDLEAYFQFAGFTFDGGEGADSITIANGNHPGAWSYTRASGFVDASKTGGGYSKRFFSTAENVTIGGGTQVDEFAVEVTPAGSFTKFFGGLGADRYTLRGEVEFDPPNLVGDLQSIRGAVQFAGDGTDLFFIDNRFDRTGRTYHVTGSRVGDQPGDDLFGFGGYLELVGPGARLSITNGTEADTVIAVAHPTMQLQLSGRNPLVAPGDALRLTLAANPVFTPQGVDSGTFAFGNAAAVSYAGFETVATAIGGDFDGDGGVDGADLGRWRNDFGQAANATPADGDADVDGDVDGADFLAWQRQLGFGGVVAAATPAAIVTTVPQSLSATLPTASLAAASDATRASTPSALIIGRMVLADLARRFADASPKKAPLTWRRERVDAIDGALAAIDASWTLRQELPSQWIADITSLKKSHSPARQGDASDFDAALLDPQYDLLVFHSTSDN